jgi:predicted dehydrogenase
MISDNRNSVRYAVVGLGYFAQAAVLPAFRHAKQNSSLVALVSNDVTKLSELGDKYRVEFRGSYDDYDHLLAAGDVDAVYITLPNSMHCEFAVRAAKARVHVLCEKPMAVTVDECKQMIRAAYENDMKLMIAYRLHFESANLSAIEAIRSGAIGEPRFFSSAFSLQVQQGNIRLRRELGGGTLYDLGVYCINAARYLFRDEPIEVLAMSANNGEPRFAQVDEMTAGMLRFPRDRLASFTCSFGASDVSTFRIVGTKGELLLDPAYDYNRRLKTRLTTDGKSTQASFPKRDQVAAELVYFSDCVLTGKNPEPDGLEGLADVRVVRALYESAASRQSVKLEPLALSERPTSSQEINRPAGWTTPDLVLAESPSGDR